MFLVTKYLLRNGFYFRRKNSNFRKASKPKKCVSGYEISDAEPATMLRRCFNIWSIFNSTLRFLRNREVAIWLPCSVIRFNPLWVEYNTGSNHIERGPIKPFQNIRNILDRQTGAPIFSTWAASAPTCGQMTYLMKTSHEEHPHYDPVIIRE